MDFLSKLGASAHPFLEATKQKEKKGIVLYQKLVMAPTKIKTKILKNKIKSKIECLPLSSCFQTFRSSSSKLSTLQAP
jgi:hypothetical protein